MVEAAAALRARSTPAQTVRDASRLRPDGREASDYQPVDELMALPVANSKHMLADKGYDGDDVRSGLLIKGILPVIPPRTNRRKPVACDVRADRDRNRIERMFNRLKHSRRIATRSRPDRGFLNLAAARIWLSFLVNRT